MLRTAAFPDLNANDGALQTLLGCVPSAERLIVMGDAIFDRGQDSAAIVECLQTLPIATVPLAGNHEMSLFALLNDPGLSLGRNFNANGIGTLKQFPLLEGYLRKLRLFEVLEWDANKVLFSHCPLPAAELQSILGGVEQINAAFCLKVEQFLDSCSDAALNELATYSQPGRALDPNLSYLDLPAADDNVWNKLVSHGFTQFVFGHSSAPWRISERRGVQVLSLDRQFGADPSQKMTGQTPSFWASWFEAPYISKAPEHSDWRRRACEEGRFHRE